LDGDVGIPAENAFPNIVHTLESNPDPDTENRMPVTEMTANGEPVLPMDNLPGHQGSD